MVCLIDLRATPLIKIHFIEYYEDNRAMPLLIEGNKTVF